MSDRIPHIDFDLLDRKEVGETTNMLDIVTAMQLADKVINLRRAAEKRSSPAACRHFGHSGRFRFLPGQFLP